MKDITLWLAHMKAHPLWRKKMPCPQLHESFSLGWNISWALLCLIVSDAVTRGKESGLGPYSFVWRSCMRWIWFVFMVFCLVPHTVWEQPSHYKGLGEGSVLAVESGAELQWTGSEIGRDDGSSGEAGVRVDTVTGRGWVTAGCQMKAPGRTGLYTWKSRPGSGQHGPGLVNKLNQGWGGSGRNRSRSETEYGPTPASRVVALLGHCRQLTAGFYLHSPPSWDCS